MADERPPLLPAHSKPVRLPVGVIQQGTSHHITACADEHSKWVEIAGPKGGNAWELGPTLARELAAYLNAAANAADYYGDDRK